MEAPPPTPAYFTHKDHGAVQPSAYIKMRNLSGRDIDFFRRYLNKVNNDVFYREITGGRKYRGGCERAPGMGFRAFASTNSEDNDPDTGFEPPNRDVVTMGNPNGQIEVYLKFTMDTKDLLTSEFMALRDEDKARVLRNSDPRIRDSIIKTHVLLRKLTEKEKKNTEGIIDALSRTNQNKYVALAAFVDMA